MRIGSLVKFRLYTDPEKIGIVTSISSPNPIATVLWANGETGAIHTKWLEVICE